MSANKSLPNLTSHEPVNNVNNMYYNQIKLNSHDFYTIDNTNISTNTKRQIIKIITNYTQQIIFHNKPKHVICSHVHFGSQFTCSQIDLFTKAIHS